MTHIKKLSLCFAIFTTTTTLIMNGSTNATSFTCKKFQYNGRSEFDDKRNNQRNQSVSSEYQAPIDSNNSNYLKIGCEIPERVDRECQPEGCCSCVSNCIQSCMQKVSEAVSKYRTTKEESQSHSGYKPLVDDGSF